jgi:hypothetical protein
MFSSGIPNRQTCRSGGALKTARPTKHSSGMPFSAGQSLTGGIPQEREDRASLRFFRTLVVSVPLAHDLNFPRLRHCKVSGLEACATVDPEDLKANTHRCATLRERTTPPCLVPGVMHNLRLQLCAGHLSRIPGRIRSEIYC